MGQFSLESGSGDAWLARRVKPPPPLRHQRAVVALRPRRASMVEPPDWASKTPPSPRSETADGSRLPPAVGE